MRLTRQVRKFPLYICLVMICLSSRTYGSVLKRWSTGRMGCNTVRGLRSSDSSIYQETKAARPPTILFVLGGPGSGKGTQAELLSREFGLKHISAGELLREEIRRDSRDSAIIRDVLSKGHIVPAEITVKLLKSDIARKQCSHYIIDGFPRNMANLKAWLETTNDATPPATEDGGDASSVLRAVEDGVIFIDCSDDQMRTRLTRRGRADDTADIINTRIAESHKEFAPVISHFHDHKQLFRVNGDQGVQEVYRDITAALSHVLSRYCDK